MLRFNRLGCVLVLVWWSFRSGATVAVQNYWRLGENDPGAANGGLITNSVDLVGGGSLSRVGLPVYSTNVARAAANTATTLSAKFAASGQSLVGPALAGVTNNFGIELWVNPANVAGNQCLVYNGNTVSNGWGLYLAGGSYTLRIGGVSPPGGSSPATNNSWTHLALVTDTGVATLYVNGNPSVSTTTNFVPPAGNFLIGANNVGGDSFSGCADEVRRFTFVPGHFSTNDLLLFHLPVVSTLPATGVSNTVAKLNGLVNPGGLNTSAWFEWDNAAFNYAQATIPVVCGNALTNVTVANFLPSLVPGNVYHGRVSASNALGIVHGGDVVFAAPAVSLVGAATLTNECHAPFTDPGAQASGVPLAISSGVGHNLALKQDGTVAAWGYNSSGQTMVPAGLSTVVGIAAGGFFSLALRNDGTLGGWGDNSFGETTIQPGLTNVIAIAGGAFHSLALKSDGTVTAWGLNNLGQTNVPAGLTNIVAIGAGEYYSVALLNNGTVVAWGDNSYGQTNVPAGLTNIVSIAAAQYHVLALKNDGTITAWGDDTYGETNIPAGLTNAVAVAGGYDFSMVLRSDRTVVVWGYGGDGETNVPYGLTNVVAISSGYYSCLALQGNGTVVEWQDNTYGQANIPYDLTQLNATVGGSVNTNLPGTYGLTYQCLGPLGGIGLVHRTVVVTDTTPPVITLNGANPMVFNNASRVFADPGATAVDACGGNFAVNVISNNVNASFPGTYAITYSSTDSYGNVATATRVVAVTLPPAVAGDLNGDGVVSQAELNHVYSNYLVTSPWLYLTNVAGLGGTNVTFALSNSIAGGYSVQYSTNLANWLPLGAATPRYLFTDTNAPAQPRRYYRLTYP